MGRTWVQPFLGTAPATPVDKTSSRTTHPWRIAAVDVPTAPATGLTRRSRLRRCASVASSPWSRTSTRVPLGEACVSSADTKLPPDGRVFNKVMGASTARELLSVPNDGVLTVKLPNSWNLLVRRHSRRTQAATRRGSAGAMCAAEHAPRCCPMCCAAKDRASDAGWWLALRANDIPKRQPVRS